VDELYRIATGWLGWPPCHAWDATVTEILLSWDAKIEFLDMTNPKPPPEKPPDKQALARDIRVGLRAAALNRKQA